MSGANRGQKVSPNRVDEHCRTVETAPELETSGAAPYHTIVAMFGGRRKEWNRCSRWKSNTKTSITLSLAQNSWSPKKHPSSSARTVLIVQKTRKEPYTETLRTLTKWTLGPRV